MVEQGAPDYPTNFHLGRGCENRPLWKVMLHVHGVVKVIGRVVGN